MNETHISTVLTSNDLNRKPTFMLTCGLYVAQIVPFYCIVWGWFILYLFFILIEKLSQGVIVLQLIHLLYSLVKIVSQITSIFAWLNTIVEMLIKNMSLKGTEFVWCHLFKIYWSKLTFIICMFLFPFVVKFANKSKWGDTIWDTFLVHTTDLVCRTQSSQKNRKQRKPTLTRAFPSLADLIQISQMQTTL